MPTAATVALAQYGLLCAVHRALAELALASGAAHTAHQAAPAAVRGALALASEELEAAAAQLNGAINWAIVEENHGVG